MEICHLKTTPIALPKLITNSTALVRSAIISKRSRNISVYLTCLTQGIALYPKNEYDHGLSHIQCDYFRECCQYTFFFSFCLPSFHIRSCMSKQLCMEDKTFHLVVCISILLAPWALHLLIFFLLLLKAN